MSTNEPCTPAEFWSDDLAAADLRAPHADRDRSEPLTIVAMVDSSGRPATIYTPPEDLRRDPYRWPTPREFVDEWEKRSATDRLALAERLIADGQTAAQCAATHLDLGRPGPSYWSVARVDDELKAAAARYLAAHPDEKAELDRLAATLELSRHGCAPWCGIEDRRCLQTEACRQAGQ